MIIAQRVYSLDLAHHELEILDLPDHTAPRPAADLSRAAAATAMMIDHLAAQGFDVSGLRLAMAGPESR